ncbi:hypothetical protein [Hungateiclostridium cellulolyticum]
MGKRTKKAGYATDSNYANSLIKNIEVYGLKLDGGANLILIL